MTATALASAVAVSWRLAAVLAGQTTPDPTPVDVGALEPLAVRALAFAIWFGLVTAIGWFLVEPVLSRVVRARNRHNRTLQEAFTRYVRLVVLVVASLVGFAAAGYSAVVGDSALVIAALTLALGIAGQQVIGSLVSGLALVVDPEFNVGDYVRWDGGEGEVASITLRVTRVRTEDGGLVTIPNTLLTEGTLERPFATGTSRATAEVGIAYDADVGAALRALVAAAEAVDGVRADPPPEAGVSELGDGAVRVTLRYWIDDPVAERYAVRSAVDRAVLERLEEAGVVVDPRDEHDVVGSVRVDDGG